MGGATGVLGAELVSSHEPEATYAASRHTSVVPLHWLYFGYCDVCGLWNTLRHYLEGASGTPVVSSQPPSLDSQGGVSVLAILTYHSLDLSGSVLSVAPQQFAEHMAHLAHLGLQGMALREAVAHRNAHGTWPERGVVLTFDDGYANCYEAALPVLRQHGFTATVFLVSGHMGGYNDWEPPLERLGTQPMLNWEQVAALARLYPFRKRSIANKHLGFSFDTRVFECPVKQPTLKKCKLPTFNGLYYQRFRPYRNG